MSVSLPSKQIIVIDVPEVPDFAAEYQYNFFTTDELITEQSKLDTIVKGPESINLDYINSIASKVPRLVKFSFSPVKVHDFINNSDIGIINFNNHVIYKDVIKNALAANKITNEDEFSSSNFLAIDFQDVNIDYKVASGIEILLLLL